MISVGDLVIVLEPVDVEEEYIHQEWQNTIKSAAKSGIIFEISKIREVRGYEEIIPVPEYELNGGLWVPETLLRTVYES